MTRKYGQIFVVGRRCFGGNAERRQTNIRFKQRNFENEVASGTKVATCTIKRRRLLYFPQGTESFNPVMIQIIVSADVHPYPGPNSKQKRNSRPRQDTKENHSTASAVGQHSNSKLIVLFPRTPLSKQIMSADKYPTIFWRQMRVIAHLLLLRVLHHCRVRMNLTICADKQAGCKFWAISADNTNPLDRLLSSSYK